MIQNKAIDIVIPVYNALDELKECLDSIVKHTDLTSNRVVIINDCSPDQQVAVYLQSVQIDNVIILSNEVNKGFVSTVNKGMAYSDHDVVLLNSDTVVTANWLEKLRIAAYSHESIATVTPFTNNGTICSVPNFCEDNVIPEGYSVDSFASFIERISLREYIELPTAVGFCMFIKRSIIEEIGLFDDITFAKGYGEENDFCCRAIELGYKNILADDTFIYHKGSMSFKEEKADLIRENSKKLNKKHPTYDHSVYEFIHVYNPLKKLHENIQFFMDQYRYGDQIKGNILYLCHNFFDQEYNQPVGGTEYHLKDMTENLKDFNIFVLVSNYNELVLKHYRNSELVNKYFFKLDFPITAFHFHHKQYEEYIEKILVSFNIDLVHVQHLKRHSFDAPYTAKRLGIPVVFTLHDYYLLTPRHEFDFLELFGEKGQQYHEQAFVQKWQNEIRKLIHVIDLFVTPTQITKTIYLDKYPEMDITVIEHGIHVNEQKQNAQPQEVSLPLRLGFIGGLSPIKGSELIYKIIKNYDKNKFEWHLIGGIGDQRLNLLTQKNLIKHGVYKREELSGILQKANLDAAVFLSQVPETFSYTLSEAWNNGLPVIVSPVGALKERTEASQAGWVLEQNSIESFDKLMSKLLENNAEQIAKIKTKAQNLELMDVSKMADIYADIYLSRCNKIIPGKQGFSLVELKISRNYFGDSIAAESPSNQYVDFLETELRNMKSTIGWKVLELCRIRFHRVLQFGKKVIYMVLKFRRKRD